MIEGLVDGKYRVLATLGQGGMGTVFEAEHTGTGRRIALKMIAREAMLSPEFVRRFQREARAAGAIDTQHIVQVFDTGTDQATGSPFIALELLTGFDLDNLIGRVGKLPVDVALRIAFQACLGLAKAHAANVVHRDIKPANLYLARRDAGEVIVKILDFGIAKVMAESKASAQVALTRPGGVLGSPAYMSPEQALGLDTVDHRTDLWSIGVVLYEAIGGCVPFERPTVGECITAICTADPQPIEQLVTGTPPAVAAFIRRAMQRKPADRFQTAAEMIEALEPLLPHGRNLHQAMLEPGFRGSASFDGQFFASRHSPGPMPVRFATTGGDAARKALTESNKRGVDAMEFAATHAVESARSDPTVDPVDDAARLLNTTIADRYTLVRMVGVGGMGAVYEAIDRDGAHYALKVILPDVALRSTEATRRFVLEARAGLKLRSEFITQMVEAGHDEARRLPFIVMELLKGIDIGRHVEQHGPMAPAVAAKVFREACIGLGVAHELGMTHRDIKPENIFLHEAADGTIVPKLCDFGVAKQDGSLEELRATALTRTGSMLGSPMYMSPEQAQNPARADVRSDIWSMGISLYEALCGHPAWQGATTVGELLLRLYTVDVPSIQDVAPWVEPDLAAVVHKALRREPKARYATAAEFADALAPFCTNQALLRSTALSVPPETMKRVAERAVVGTTTSPSTAPPGRPPAAEASGRRAMMVGGGAMIAMAGAIGVLLYRATAGSLAAASASASASPAQAVASAPSAQAAVTIRPKSARVTVDGVAASAQDGVLHLQRRPGTTAIIRVEQDERSVERTVVITESGTAMPDVVDLPAEAPAPSTPATSAVLRAAPRPPRSTSRPVAAASGPVAPSPAPAAPAASTPRLKTTW